VLPAIESVINSMGITPVRSRTDKWRYGGEEIGFQQGVGTPRAGNYGKQTPGAEGNTKRGGRACRPRAAYHALCWLLPCGIRPRSFEKQSSNRQIPNRLENDGAHLPFLDMPVHSQSP